MTEDLSASGEPFVNPDGSGIQAGLEAVEAAFQGEATRAERDRVTAIARRQGADISVGVGGGKIYPKQGEKG
jgi:hypothetical protein